MPATDDILTLMTLANEFATVEVKLDRAANGPRLRIVDPASGVSIALDPLELYSLAWARHEDLLGLLQPSLRDRLPWTPAPPRTVE
jgi:hypothetical protein